MSENYELTVGSKYQVELPDDISILGTFCGYSMIGTESAIVMKVERDRIRFIPVAQITYLDLVASAEEPAARSRPENLYG